MLLGEIRAGDYIEIGQMGPQRESRYDFGGFLPAASVIVNDPARLRRASMHEKQFYSLGPGGFHRIAIPNGGRRRHSRR